MIDLVDAEIGPLAERVEGIVLQAYNDPDYRRILADLTTRPGGSVMGSMVQQATVWAMAATSRITKSLPDPGAVALALERMAKAFRIAGNQS